MKDGLARGLSHAIFWLIALIPFSVAIAPAAANVFMGMLIFCFLFKSVLKKEPVFVKGQVGASLAVFFLLTCLSLFYTPFFKDTFRGGVLRLLQYSFVFLAVAQQVRSRRQVRAIIFSCAAALLLTAINEIWQVKSGWDFIRGYAPIVNIGLTRATSSFKDANTLGIYLSALVPLVLGLALYYYRGTKRAVFYSVSALALIGAVLTYSRPTLLALYLALFFMGLVRRDKVLIAVLLTLALAAPFIMPRPVKQWAKEVEYNPLRFMCNDDRIAVYLHTMQMINDHPVRGGGANTFMKNFKNYNNPPHYRGVLVIDYIYAHNMYLQLAGELGLLGLAVFAWFIFSIFRQSAAIYRGIKDNLLSVASLSIMGCIAAFLVNGLTESSLYYSRVAIIFWYIAGLSLALGKVEQA